jgi:hypothetical protein
MHQHHACSRPRSITHLLRTAVSLAGLGCGEVDQVVHDSRRGAPAYAWRAITAGCHSCEMTHSTHVSQAEASPNGSPRTRSVWARKLTSRPRAAAHSRFAAFRVPVPTDRVRKEPLPCSAGRAATPPLAALHSEARCSFSVRAAPPLLHGTPPKCCRGGYCRAREPTESTRANRAGLSTWLWYLFLVTSIDYACHRDKN